MGWTISQAARAFLAALALSAFWVQPADARRGGSFGSRGSRTYYAPAPTMRSPNSVAPIQRSMTGRPATAQTPGYASQPPQAMPGRRFGGFGGGLIGGLLAGGLIGGLMGHGIGGGGGGFLISLIQLALLGGIIWLVVRLFRRKAASGQPYVTSTTQQFGRGFREPTPAPQFVPASPATPEFAITETDKAAFERLLNEVQDAFGHEDYGRLRECTTPEMMSYLAEELSQNATRGVRNDVTATRLIDAEISEAWTEAPSDYATVAMRFESIDVMRDRNTRAVIEGDPNRPSETTEHWTFVRQEGAPWTLSAIQDG
jgi:predicted lipid-binding transport protein (Tim44 family)